MKGGVYRMLTFNRIYDELEMRITDYMNGQSKKM